jgi:ABC-type transport system involved in cytochrome bd biosynthesis fused ATPase/permease subunit
VEYLELPQEPPVIVESSRPPAYWPTSGSDNLVVVEDLVVKYAPELPPVLHNVSFTLRGGERVGLLGRTGGSMSPRFYLPFTLTF